MSKILVLDNGSDVCKAGWAPQLVYNVIPNYAIHFTNTDKTYIADECHKVDGLSSLQYDRPSLGGNILDWDLQKQIWDHVFLKPEIKANPEDTTLVFLESPMFSQVCISLIFQPHFQLLE